eukprot:TRINITY_DN43608_c0_g1_i1.p1 TRINITY_DN43608_c0_g1~~TRINITY_DN43608_c0_g1_i1.p1  ORF type:complete len:393 (-),score=137.11 TRINITY_DN43608_c0_g1_i1:92-1270(-)
MAPKKGTKRAAPPAAEDPAKKLLTLLRQRGISKTNYEAVVEAINHPLAAGLDDLTRQMLIATLPNGLFVAKSDRLEPQQISVTMLEEVFQGIMSKMQIEISEASQALAAETASMAGSEKLVEEAQAALQAASDAANARKGELAEATKTMMDAKALHSQKETEQKDGDAAHERAKQEKQEAEDLSQDFRVLRDGEAEEAEAKIHYQKLTKILGRLGLEESMLQAIPTCMVKKPSARGAFDAMVVTQLEEALTKKVQQLAEEVAAGEPSATARAAAVTEAHDTFHAAKQAQQQVAEALSAANGLQEQRRKDLEAARATLAEHAPSVKVATDAKAKKEEQLQSFRDYNFACFQEARDKEAPGSKQSAPAVPEDPMALAARQLAQAAQLEAAEAGA